MNETTLLPPPTIETVPPKEVLKPLKPKFKIPSIVLIVVLSLIFVGGIFAAYYYGASQKAPVSTLPTPTETQNQVQPTSIPTIATQDDDSEFGTLTWYSSPKKIVNPPILSSTTTPDWGTYTFADLGTYEVGKFSKGATLILSFIMPEGPVPAIPIRFIADNSKYYLIESLVTDSSIKKNLDNIFNKSKVEYISYQIKDLYYDNYYFLDKVGFSVVKDLHFSSPFVSSIKNFKIAAVSPVGDIVMTEEPAYNFSDLSNRNYYLKLKDFSLVSYKKDSAIYSSADKVPNFYYLNNTQNKSQFSSLNTGCGSGINTTVISNTSLLNSKTLIGKSGSTEIFQVLSADSPLVKYLYDQYKVGRDYPSAPPFLSIDQFAQVTNHIIFQERTGEWTLLINQEYTMQAECGKPVVYLYPTEDTIVNLRVGASVTQSEPLYIPGIGWTGILAHPNGQLDYQGKTYSSLYWEGRGVGSYPSISNYGVVVSQKKLISTLKSQLTQLGLNSQESADFMEFWAPKLPTSPYVRLTWLNTKDMDTLAPLAVFPAPDTRIRIFLDFAGLEKPIKLIPQKLSAPPRLGFTLVEWGGLLVK